jgi:hypothetical protein
LSPSSDTVAHAYVDRPMPHMARQRGDVTALPPGISTGFMTDTGTCTARGKDVPVEAVTEATAVVA